MEINVWSRRRLCVLAVTVGLSLSTSSIAVPRQNVPTSSPNALESVAVSTSTYRTIPESQKGILRIKRSLTTTGKESRFGVMEYEGRFLCYTLENATLELPAGTYRVVITYSPHFHRPMPLILGTYPRTGIRIHPANWPAELGGCIAVGQAIDGRSLSSSVLAFNSLFLKIKDDLDNGRVVQLTIS